MSEEKRPRIQSVARAASILFTIAQHENGVSRKEISRINKISTQTTYHLLHTLAQSGLVTRNETGSYVLGIRVGTLGEGFRRQLGGVAQISSLIRNIARETGETTYAAKWIDGNIVSVDLVRGRHPIQALELPHGFAEDGHARAGGKVLLAYATDEIRREYLQTHALRQRTPNTITSITELETQFKLIRRQEYAFENEEFAPGLSCVGVPIDGGLSPYAIGISAPSERMVARFEDYLKILRSQTAALIG
jgi:IclR family transcriptional regulator, acetate operon repressor